MSSGGDFLAPRRKAGTLNYMTNKPLKAAAALFGVLVLSALLYGACAASTGNPSPWNVPAVVWQAVEGVVLNPPRAKALAVERVQNEGLTGYEMTDFRDYGEGRYRMIFECGGKKYDVSVEKRDGSLQVVRAGYL